VRTARKNKAKKKKRKSLRTIFLLDWTIKVFLKFFKVY